MPALTRLLHCGNGLRVLHALAPYPVGTTLTDVALADNHLDWPACASHWCNRASLQQLAVQGNRVTTITYDADAAPFAALQLLSLERNQIAEVRRGPGRRTGGGRTAHRLRPDAP
jgi:hypothetical protein